MVYQGSKNRIAKDIIPFMLPFLNGKNYFIDAFCGGCNLIDKVDYPNKIASDINPYLIALFTHLQNGGELPAFIAKEEYYKVKANKDDYEDWYVGHIGFNCSRLGKFFDCYVGEQNGRNYQEEHNNNILKQISNLRDVVFLNLAFDEILTFISCEDVLYCDIPYKDTRKYKHNINYELFYSTVRARSIYGQKIFISEYNMPSDFKCIWSKEITNSINPRITSKPTEKLFVHEKVHDEVVIKQNIL